MAVSFTSSHALPRAGAAAQAASPAPPVTPVRPDLLASPVGLLTGRGTLAERLADARMRPPL